MKSCRSIAEPDRKFGKYSTAVDQWKNRTQKFGYCSGVLRTRLIPNQPLRAIARPRLRASLALGLMAVLALLTVEHAAAQQPMAAEVNAPPPPAQRARARTERKRALEPGEKIDLNTASVDELRRLPGIGAKRAEQIVALRDKRPFRRVTELRRVRGVGKKTLRRLLPHLKVTPPPKTAQASKKKRKKPAAE